MEDHSAGFSKEDCPDVDTDLVESFCFDADSFAIKMIRMLPYVFIILVSVVGNVLVAYVVFKSRPMRKAINFFIVSMAISDLLITVVYMPRVIGILLRGYEWLSKGIAGLVFCKLVYFIHETAVSVSIFSAICISGERFVAVVRPLRTFAKNTKPARYFIALTWIISSFMRIPELVANGIGESCGKVFCNRSLDDAFWPGSTVAYHKVNLIGMYATPLGVMIALYSATICSLKKRSQPGNRVTSETTQATDMNKKVSRLVLVVTTAFILCWMLYFIIAVLESYDVKISCNILYLRLLLAHFNCALTPVLYALFSENYQREFKNVFFACLGVRRSRLRRETVERLDLGNKDRAWTVDTNVSVEFQLQIGPVGPEDWNNN